MNVGANWTATETQPPESDSQASSDEGVGSALGPWVIEVALSDRSVGRLHGRPIVALGPPRSRRALGGVRGAGSVGAGAGHDFLGLRVVEQEVAGRLGYAIRFCRAVPAMRPSPQPPSVFHTSWRVIGKLFRSLAPVGGSEI